MTTTAHDGPTPTAPSSRALRVIALGGLLALLASLVLTCIVVLNDAISGDGVSGPAAMAGFWALGLGAVAGLAAAATPRAALAHRARATLVAAEYALALTAPLLALLD
ncbi:hypothetical protein [Streptomyces purpureus]|uniref:Uncharacterized protein n=1 Tax=Streptomyces purpureus TaxID=1951 RepID=A0A918H4M5_9ACTN|nr:hypothetical protein [Streptomyces purpureus]GGT37038.1 hypothetical protein GCM10014713_33490 [Streptomyces purpureus]